ncbi:hypothetical protein AB9N12_03465 [Bacteroides sp. AN502(2024)]|uniref:hypothetical protein n=1 Tax=Bacteroides sp. AN502(2024) TaxID=3160599 RepID=UPI00351604AD
MKKLDYTFPIEKRGILPPDEEHFFYYDIMRNTENNNQNIYNWNSDIQKFLDNKGVIVDTKETLPDKAMKDELYFIIEKKDKENKAAAFFNHLRNAFAHFRIVHVGEYLRIEDGRWDTKNKCLERTMIGQIKYEDLKELCFLFFQQEDKFIEENNI